MGVVTISIGGGFVVDMNKLNSKNYFVWRKRAEYALTEQDAWEAVYPGYGEDMTEEEKSTDAKAMIFILSAVEDDLLWQIDQLERAKDMWNALKKFTTNDDPRFIAHLLKAQTNVVMEPGESMQSYFDRFNEIYYQLEAVGFQFSDNIMAHMCLMGLPPRYKRAVERLQHEGDPKLLRKGKVYVRMMNEEKNLNAEIEESRVMAATSNVRTATPENYGEQRENQNCPSKSRPETQSFRCKKIGHVAKFPSTETDSENMTKSKAYNFFVGIM